jgi:hypothetical protein
VAGIYPKRRTASNTPPFSLVNEHTFTLCGILLHFHIKAKSIVTLLIDKVMPALRNDCQPINATRAQALHELTNPLVGGTADRKR